MKERQILDNDNFCPFKLSKYDNLVIIGHSCGVNDYEYFFHIFDENPDINVFLCWYSYGDKKDNKESLTNNFYNLIYEYEKKRQNERLTKMNISNNIHRVEIEIIS